MLGAIFGYLVLWAVHRLFRLVRGIDGMGYGDFKLLAALGAVSSARAALPQIVLVAAWRARSSASRPRGAAACASKNRCLSGRFWRRAARSPFLGTPLYLALGG